MLIVVMLMVVPVPSAILDLGFVVNIMISLAVLMVTLNAAKPLDFSSFPTVLLLATIFRLALNIASTRVVLVRGHEGTDAAGHVIEAFGEFLIGGDFIVGIFVFLVLLIVNIAVISKGAGRISEVSARFTLDALPGKQMAIDADLNAGLITVEEARARRVDVSTEADFYGSMDGASKFVKGDAMAGIIILVINIVGGLILGIFRHNLDLATASKTYIILAIGDALVAQIPALLLSIAAAAIVTRVASPYALGEQISRQFASTRVWGPVTLILAVLAVLPGMPHLALIPPAMLSGYFYWRCSKATVEGEAPVEIDTEKLKEAPGQITLADITDNDPIELQLGFALIELADPRKGEPLMSRITGIRRQISRELGFVMPPVRVSDNLTIDGNRYLLDISGEIVGQGDVWPQELLALDSGDCLSKIEGRDVKDPTFELDATWIKPARKSEAIANGYTVVDPSTVIATHLHNALQKSAYQLFGLDECQSLIDNLKETHPQLAQNLLPQPYSLSDITGLCRDLLRERISIKDFRNIAEALVECRAYAKERDALLEAVRQRLAPIIGPAAHAVGEDFEQPAIRPLDPR